MFHFGFCVFTIFWTFAFSDKDVLVHLSSGTIRGKQSITNTNKTFYSFLKVPYATPPLGELRFQAPTSVKNWEGVLNATSNNVVCYQVSTNSENESEDCLYLNIYTSLLPSGKEEKLLPVLFNIHGGGFIDGSYSPSDFGPEFLIDFDVVVVTVNYRLGPFGFLSTSDLTIPGNNGLKDQHFALKWVHNNIKLFGGESEKITIVGQSAGASSVTYHMLNKECQGLFWGAICQSGTFLSPWSFQRNPRDIAFKMAALINETFAHRNSSEELLEFLSGLSAKELDKASYELHLTDNLESRQVANGYFFAPVLEPEHEAAYITKKMYNELQSGNFVKVPTIMGFTSEESIEEDGRDLNLLKEILKTYDENLDWIVPNDLNVKNVEEKKMIGELIRSIYTDTTFKDNLAAGIKYFSDNFFTRSIIKHAELQSKFADVYFYQFSYDGIMGNVSSELEGTGKVAHSEDLKYMWKTVTDSYSNERSEEFPEADVLTQKRLLTMLTNFAKTLNPTPEKVEILGNVLWPTVDTEGSNHFLYLDINKNLTVKKYPKIGSYLAWKKIYDVFGEGEFDTN